MKQKATNRYAILLIAVLVIIVVAYVASELAFGFGKALQTHSSPTTVISTAPTSVVTTVPSTWNSTTQIPRAGSIPSCLTYNQTVYCVTDNSTYYARMSSNNSGLGKWYLSTAYPTLNGTICVSYNYTAYCLSAGNQTGLAYYSALSSNGFNEWKPTTPNPANWGGFSCVAHNGYVYCI